MIALFLVFGTLIQTGWCHPARIVIDPGHGGSDYGASYVDPNSETRLLEKHITLGLSQQISKWLRKKGHWVYLTRSRDKDLALPKRTALANSLKADVFISVHMNSTDPLHPNPEAQGIETFILDYTTDIASKRLARMENNRANPNGSDVALILKDLQLGANLLQSRRLACAIQSHLVETTSHARNIPLRDRGVKQALFHVLLGADMPSVLVEAGFLNHPADQRWLTSRVGIEQMGRSIATAIDQFLMENPKSESRLISTSTLDRCKLL